MAHNFFYWHPDDNVAPDAALSVVAGTEDGDYTVDKTVSLDFVDIANSVRFLQTSAVQVQGNFGAAQRLDGLLLWSNLDEAVAVTFKMNSSASWGSPTLSKAITIPARRADGYARKVFIDLRDVTGYTSAGRQYFLFDFTGVNSVPIAFKFMLFSQNRELDVDLMNGMEDDQYSVSIEQRTDALIKWNYDLSGAIRSMTGKVKCTNEEAEELREWVRSCSGINKVTAFVPDPDNSPDDAWVVCVSGGDVQQGSGANINIFRHRTTHVEYNVNEVQISVEEVSIGDPEWT